MKRALEELVSALLSVEKLCVRDTLKRKKVSRKRKGRRPNWEGNRERIEELCMYEMNVCDENDKMSCKKREEPVYNIP